MNKRKNNKKDHKKLGNWIARSLETEQSYYEYLLSVIRSVSSWILGFQLTSRTTSSCKFMGTVFSNGNHSCFSGYKQRKQDALFPTVMLGLYLWYVYNHRFSSHYLKDVSFFHCLGITVSITLLSLSNHWTSFGISFHSSSLLSRVISHS